MNSSNKLVNQTMNHKPSLNGGGSRVVDFGFSQVAAFGSTPICPSCGKSLPADIQHLAFFSMNMAVADLIIC